MKIVQITSDVPAERWPWQWSYALFLEKRWEQIMELSAIYGDEDSPGDDKEIPKEYWHDSKRVNEWVERMKEKRKEKYRQ